MVAFRRKQQVTVVQTVFWGKGCGDSAGLAFLKARGETDRPRGHDGRPQSGQVLKPGGRLKLAEHRKNGGVRIRVLAVRIRIDFGTKRKAA
jgi:hypothetical protein